MSPDTWRRIDEIVKDALDRAPGERTALIRARCGGDGRLESQVRRLVTSCTSAADFLERPLVPRTIGVNTEDVREREPPRIAGYRIHERIGAGGMGEVFLAERQRAEFRQQVAIKIVKRGMDTEEILSRFRREQRTLAELSHAHIARLLDGGATDDGRPFLVMEFVDGEPITHFCERRALPLEQRLQLFLTVCAAVQYAHRRLVVHRDIKPGNIFVTQDGAAKLLDFGIAKVLRPGEGGPATVTRAELRPLTPEYASPEQIRGQSVSTASDVYSLGVVLYELLAGRRPYELEHRSLAEIERIVSGSEPPRPSAVLTTEAVPAGSSRAARAWRRRLRGDLDTIVLAALRKEPERRYASVERMAEDIERWLSGRPIRARPDTLRYRAAKFVGRNRAAVTAGVLVALSLLGALLVTSRQARIATVQRNEALANLWHAYLAQARAQRLSGAPGQRFQVLDAIGRAAAIRPSIELRSEAISALALTDIRVQRAWEYEYSWSDYIRFDAALRLEAVARQSGTLIRDLQTGEDVLRLEGYRALLSFSPDGRYVAASKGREIDSPLEIWDIGRRARILDLPLRPVQWPEPSFSAGGEKLAFAGSGGGVHVIELPAGASHTLSPPDESQWSFAGLHPGGALLAAASRDSARVALIDASNGQVQAVLDHPAPVRGVCWSGDGSQLAVSCRNHALYVWDADSRELRHALAGHAADVWGMRFSNAGDLLVSTSWDHTTRFWSLISGQAELVMPGFVLGFSPDDSQLAFCDPRGQRMAVGIAHVAARREVRVFGAAASSGPVEAIEFSADGRWMLTSGASGVTICDSDSGRELARVALNRARGARLLADGTLLTADDEGIRRWGLRPSGGRVEVLEAAAPAAAGQGGLLCVSKDLAAVSLDLRTVLILGLENAAAPTRISGPEMHFAAISPNQSLLATGSWRETGVHVWSLRSGEPVATLPADGRANVVFSPDGRWLVAASLQENSVWEKADWSLRASFEIHVPGRLPLACFSPDGEYLAALETASAFQLIETAGWSKLATVELPRSAPIQAMRFSPDSQTLACGAGSGQLVYLWYLPAIREQLRRLGLDW